MSAIKEIRELTGLSQYKLAEWLGVSRSMVYLVEKGKRFLPSEASVKLSAMLLLLQSLKKGQDENNLPGHPKHLIPSLAEEHQKMIQFHEEQVASLRKQAKKLETIKSKASSKISLLKNLQEEDLPFFQKSEADKKWLETMEWFGRNRLTVLSATSEAALAEKIETHLGYLRIHRERLDVLKRSAGEN